MGKFCLLRHRNRWGKKKKERGGNWPYATLKEGKKFVLRRSGIPFRKEEEKEGSGGRGRSPPSTLAIWFDLHVGIGHRATGWVGGGTESQDLEFFPTLAFAYTSDYFFAFFFCPHVRKPVAKKGETLAIL